MKKESLDRYDKRPEAMENYLRYYGWHFNKKMCEFAIKHMDHEGKDLKSVTKEHVESILATYNVNIENDVLYDKVYVYAMLKSDFCNGAIPDERHLAAAVKLYLDDEDGYDEIAFSRYYIDTIKKGIPIDWEEML